MEVVAGRKTLIKLIKNMDNHNDNNSKNMLWMMVICCLGPIVFILLAGNVNFKKGGSLFSGGYFFPILIGLFVLIHIYMMFQKRGKDNRDGKDKFDGSCH